MGPMFCGLNLKCRDLPNGNLALGRAVHWALTRNFARHVKTYEELPLPGRRRRVARRGLAEQPEGRREIGGIRFQGFEVGSTWMAGWSISRLPNRPPANIRGIVCRLNRKLPMCLGRIACRASRCVLDRIGRGTHSRDSLCKARETALGRFWQRETG